MASKGLSKDLWCLYVILFFFILFGEITLAQADLTLGKRYDQTNYQEIQDLLFPALLNWVKNGKVTLQTEQLDFEWMKGDAFLEASLKNEGKYDIDKDGMLIEKSTGKPPNFIYGFPFPKIDSKDPRAAEKIMENHSAQLYSMGSFNTPSDNKCISANGRIERRLKANTSLLFYQQRRQDTLPNPENLLFQELSRILEPFSLKGANFIILSYADLRQNSGLVYVPSLRRFRKISVADSSDPNMSTDFAQDDYFGWFGKNANMKWKLIGEKTLLMPFSSAKKVVVTEFPDGGIDRIFVDHKIGHEVPGWKGAPWYPVSSIWSPVSFWIVEANPKDSNYSYGKQILYVDKGAYTIFIKEVFDRNDKYWKTTLNIGSYHVTSAGTDLVGVLDFAVMVDDRNNHSTYYKVFKLTGVDHRMHLPLSVLGPNNFTENAFIQTTK